MITLKKIQEDILDAITELKSAVEKCELEKSSPQRHRNKYARKKELLEAAKIHITFPCVEQSAKKQLDDILSKISIIDARWLQALEMGYRIPDNPNAALTTRKSHHNGQYDYTKLTKQAKYLNYILNEKKPWKSTRSNN